MTPAAHDVLEVWFGADPHLWQPEKWFVRDDTFDTLCRDRFADAIDPVIAGALDPWAATPEGALALVILLDQIPRNIHRATPRAFAGDARARDVAHQAIAAGHDEALTPAQRVFLYMPFQHSEDAADQDLSVRLFETLRGTPAGQAVPYAHSHRGVILRFGRFPHRNAMLGRASTEAELAFFAEPDSPF